MNNINDARELRIEKVKYPSMKKIIFITNNIKFVITSEFDLLNNKWWKWSCPGANRFCLFFNRIIFIDKNSYTNIDTDQASNIGWV